MCSVSTALTGTRFLSADSDKPARDSVDPVLLINPDLVIAYLGFHFPAVGIRNDEFGLLLRHVAIDAVIRNLAAHLGVDSANFDFVATQTSSRK